MEKKFMGQQTPEQEDQDFSIITSVDLSVTGTGNRPVYHFLYASQLYGTLFAVYGNFITRNISETRIELAEIEFFLVNYKGVFNMGFVSPDVAPARYYNDNTIDIHVGGMQALTKTTLRFDTPVTNEKGRRKIITMKRILHPLSSRGLQDMSSAENPAVFDEEFHYRDGAYAEERPLRDGMLGYRGDTALPTTLNQGELASLRCHESAINIIFGDGSP